MKKIISLILCVVLALSMMACAGTPASQAPASDNPVKESSTPEKTEPLKIAYFISDMTNTFHQARFAAAKKYAMDKYGAEVYAFDGKSDSAVMTQNIDQIVAQGMDMATLHIWDYDAGKPGVLEAIDKGVFITNFFSPYPGIDMPVMRNDEAAVSYEMGKKAAEQWKKDNPNKPIVMVQLGWPDHPEVKSGRTDPFVKGVLSVDPNAKNLGCLDASKGADTAKQIILDLCAQHPDVNLIYSEASNLTVGTMAALKQAGRGVMKDGKAVTEIVMSVDCDQVELKQIYDPNSSLKMSMFLPPKDTSIAIIDTLMDLYNGKIKQISTPPQECFAPAYTVNFWEMSSDDAVKLYNDQFNDTFSLK